MAGCPECGAPEGPPDCTELFHELLALDHSRRPPWGPLHGVAVATYSLQHPRGKDPSVLGGQWAMLHVYLDGGLAALEPVIARARAANSHRGGGHTRKKRTSPADVSGVLDASGAPPPLPDIRPAGFAVTISEVAEGGFPAEHHPRRTELWARATVAAWQGH